MYVVYEISQPNPQMIPSPYYKNEEQPVDVKVGRVKEILKELKLEYTQKMGPDLILITSEPTVPLDEFLKMYGTANAND